VTRRAPTSAPPTPEMKVRFGQNLARCREGADVSQEELSFRASIHRTEVSLLERGERMPRVDTALRIAGSLGVPLDDQRSLAASAAPIALGASAIASALATQRLLSSALEAAPPRRAGAHGSPPSQAAAIVGVARRSPTAAVSWRLETV